MAPKKPSEATASCGHEKIHFHIPPTTAHITQYYPFLKPNTTIDRQIPRCKLCDLIKAQERANIAANPPPGVDIIEEIENHIKAVEELLTTDIANKQIEEDLAEMKLELDNAVMLQNGRIHEAWLPHWQIWGYGDGPISPGNSLFDDGESEDVIDWGT